jgi:IrrE N-terminal-like domain
VERLVLEYTKQNFDDPITKIVGEPLDQFEGGLFPSPSGRGRWLIAYNSAISSKERIRYTIAHEFAHYLLHRKHGESILCSRQDMSIRRGAYKRQEAEANKLASGLLMPTDDYTQQVQGQPIDLQLLRVCTQRYDVSLTTGNGLSL